MTTWPGGTVGAIDPEMIVTGCHPRTTVGTSTHPPSVNTGVRYIGHTNSSTPDATDDSLPEEAAVPSSVAWAVAVTTRPWWAGSAADQLEADQVNVASAPSPCASLPVPGSSVTVKPNARVMSAGGPSASALGVQTVSAVAVSNAPNVPPQTLCPPSPG